MNKRKLYSLNLCDQENPLVVVWMKTCTNLNSTKRIRVQNRQQFSTSTSILPFQLFVLCGTLPAGLWIVC